MKEVKYLMLKEFLTLWDNPLNNNFMKVSVITTVWNVAEWIEKNIQSFLNQTLKDSELILVNDCSPDNSLEIISKYNDSRIKVINNKENLGPGVSRQIGLDNSVGEYTIFVDGDDWLEEDCLEMMYNEAIKQNADIVSCRTIQHNDYGLLEGKEVGFIYYKEDFYNFINNKLIKREIWDKTHYSPLRFREDINTLYRCLELSNNTIRMRYCGYNYNLRPNSLTSTPNIAGKSYLYNALAWIENVKWAEDRECSQQYKRQFNYRNIQSLYFTAKYLLKDTISNYSEECKIIEEYINKNKENEKTSWINIWKTYSNRG